MHQPLFWLALVGCASPHSALNAAAGREASTAAAELKELLDAVAVEGSAWPLFTAEAAPVVLAGPAWSLLLASRPQAGFRPLRGSECPCLGPAGVDTDRAGNPQLIALAVQGGRLRGRPVTREPGWFNAFVIPQNPWEPLRVREAITAHELFHYFQLAHGWHSEWPHSTDTQLPSRKLQTALLSEQLLLSRALRATGSERREAIASFLEARKVGSALVPQARDLEMMEGTAEYFGLRVLGRLERLDQGKMEERIAAVLEAGGRDLAPEAWFRRDRYYETGAAMCALLDGATSDWRKDVEPLAQSLDELLGREAPPAVKRPLDAGTAPPPVPMIVSTEAGEAKDLIDVVVRVPDGDLSWGGGGPGATTPGARTVFLGQFSLEGPCYHARLTGELDVTSWKSPTLRLFRLPLQGVQALAADGGREPLEIETRQLELRAERARISSSPGRVEIDLRECDAKGHR